MRTLIELLKPCGADLGRRWLAALLVVPAAEREAVVRAVEASIVAEYDRAANAAQDDTREIVVRYPAVQREGYVEEVVKRYGVAETKAANGAKATNGGQQRGKKRGAAG